MDQTSESTVLTFLIADVRGYTRFTRERGDAAAAVLAKKFADLARDAVAARGGSVLELRGDEALAVFDSPPQAVRAALELQATCAEESGADPAFPLPIGIGIDVGEAVPVEDGYRGVALNMAARLCSNADAGQVLVTRSIVAAVPELDGEIRFEERGPASFKGFDEAVDVIQPIAPEEQPIERPAAAETGLPPELDPLTPLVDRERELRWLRGTWRAVRRGHGRVLVVSGPAQIGKTRLAAEMAAHVSRDGSPIRYAGPGGAAAAVALAALREALRASTPTLLVLDDVDVSGPAVADAISSSFEAFRGVPALVLALLRDAAASPELASVIERVDERGDGHRMLEPFGLDGVRGILELYVGESTSEVPVEAMTRASKGVPGRVHEVVSDWARSEATRRLSAAAEFLAEGRERHASDLEFANNVIGLKLGRLYTVEGRDALVTEACPYKGLAPFEEDDAGLFFGRERLVGELAARTVQSALLGVVGGSGSGKSSVVAAGLLPSLRAGLLPGSEQWTQATMRPGERPMQELRRTLGTDAGAPLDAVLATTPADGRLVLVVDQFEETFTTCASEEERIEFIDELTGAARRWSERVAIVLGIRGDYYAHSAPYPELAERLAANHVLVGPLTREELRRAIELPARRAGLRLESQLVDAVIEEVADEPGGLPLLSTALVELWQQRDGGWIRLDAYERTGGVRGAVARLAESSYEQLSDAERDAARPIFLRLVAAGEGETVSKRPAGLEEFDLDRDPVAAAVLTRLTQDRLLRMTENTVEVAHEALLREWPRLRGWLEEDAQGRQLRQRLTQAARQWETGGREPSELYRGARLSAALDWFAGHAGDLNELEREFLTAGRQAGEQEAERQRRTNRRLRGLLVGTAVFLVVALVAGTLALVQRGSARRSARDAEHSATVALAQSLGAQSLVAKSPDLSLLLAAQSVALDDDRKTESTLLAALLRWEGVLRVFHPNESRLLRIAVSPHGTMVAISDNSSHVYVYDGATLEQRYSLARFADGVLFSKDGRTLFVASGPTPGEPEAIEAFDATTGVFRWGAAGGSGVTGFALSPDGRLLAQADDPLVDTPRGPRPSGKPHTLTVLHGADGSPAGPPITLGTFSGAAFAGPDHVVSSNGNVIEIVDLRTRRVIRTVEGAQGIGLGTSAMTASPDGVTVALARPGGNVRLVDLETGHPRILSAPSSFEIFVLKFSPDGRTLGASGANGAVVTWDVASGSARSWRGQTGNVTDLSFTADGRTMWTDGLDGTAVEWDIAGDRSLRQQFDARFPEDPNSLPFVSFTPDGRQIAVTGADHRTRFFDATTLEPAGALPRDSFECCMPPAFSDDGHLLATVDGMGVDLWDSADRSLIRHLYRSEAEADPSAPAPVDAVAISPDGSVVAANDNDTVLLLDAGTGQVERRLHAGWYVAALTFSADGDLLAADGGVPDGSQYSVVWDARTGEQLWQHEVPMQSSLASFSGDGKLYAVGNADGRVFVFGARSGRPVGTPFVGDAGFVFSVTFDPRGGIVAVTGTDGVVTLADPVTGATFGSPLVSPSEAWSTGAWSPDGSHYVILGNNGIGNVWDMSPRDWADRACRTAGRSLTLGEWRQFLPDRSYDPAC